MSLPNDIARCAGVNVDGEWRAGCESCRRRTPPSNGDRVVMMQPPEIIVFECAFLIEETP